MTTVKATNGHLAGTRGEIVEDGEETVAVAWGILDGVVEYPRDEWDERVRRGEVVVV
jgi:hypothetical protein